MEFFKDHSETIQMEKSDSNYWLLCVYETLGDLLWPAWCVITDSLCTFLAVGISHITHRWELLCRWSNSPGGDTWPRGLGIEPPSPHLGYDCSAPEPQPPLWRSNNKAPAGKYWKRWDVKEKLKGSKIRILFSFKNIFWFQVGFLWD